MPPIRKSIASLCVLVLTACAGEPFRAVAEEHDAGPGPATIPADPAIGPPVSSVAPSPKKRAYARSGPSQVAAFDPATGHVLSTTVVGEVVGDLVLDGSRLLAATSPNDLETSRVRAFDIVDGQLSLVGESNELGPGARLFPFPPYVLVLTEDMAVTWSLLDSALRLVPGSQAINRPLEPRIGERSGTALVLEQYRLRRRRDLRLTARGALRLAVADRLPLHPSPGSSELASRGR